MEAPKPKVGGVILFILVLVVVLYPNVVVRTTLADGVTPDEAKQLRDEVI